MKPKKIFKKVIFGKDNKKFCKASASRKKTINFYQKMVSSSCWKNLEKSSWKSGNHFQQRKIKILMRGLKEINPLASVIILSCHLSSQAACSIKKGKGRTKSSEKPWKNCQYRNHKMGRYSNRGRLLDCFIAQSDILIVKKYIFPKP